MKKQANFENETANTIISIKNDYFFVRCLNTGKLVDGLMKRNTIKKVAQILANADDKTFSQIWDELNAVRYLKTDFRSY